MGTTIRPEVSEKNKYWIDRHRYYELKHFCLQYPIWKKAYISLDGLSKRPADLTIISNNGVVSDPTAICAEAKLFYTERICMVDRAAFETDNELFGYIIKAVTNGLSYDKLDVPCCKDIYYDLYRRFFWLLNKARK